MTYTSFTLCILKPCIHGRLNIRKWVWYVYKQHNNLVVCLVFEIQDLALRARSWISIQDLPLIISHLLSYISRLGTVSLRVLLAVLSFSKNNSLTVYKFFKIRAIINVQILIGAKMEIIRLWNTLIHASPSLASDQTTRLCFLFPAPLVTPFETL